MKKHFTRIVSVVMVLTLVLAMSVTVFAASGFHKVNGTGSESGGTRSYTSITTKKCSKITAQGTSNSGGLHVYLTITDTKTGDTIVQDKDIKLNGTEQTVILYSSKNLPASTYEVKVVPQYSHVGYEVSTYFYE